LEEDIERVKGRRKRPSGVRGEEETGKGVREEETESGEGERDREKKSERGEREGRRD